MNRAQIVRVPDRRESPSTNQKILVACAFLWLLFVSPFAAFWAVKNYLNESNRLRPAPTTAAPLENPTPTAQYTPDSTASGQSERQQLSFMREGNIWLANIDPDLALFDEWLEKDLPKPWQVTLGWQAISYAWSPDGERVAAFDGSTVHYVSVPRVPADPQPGYSQEQMNVPQTQASTIPSMMWTPDGRRVILWNIQNPGDGSPVGWFILKPDHQDELPKIVPGRIIRMLALGNGSLIGLATAPCVQDLCSLELLRYDSLTQEFKRLELEDYRNAGGLGLFSASKDLLRDAAHLECAFSSGSSAALALGQRPSPASLEGKEMPYDFLLAPDGLKVLIARGVACNDRISSEWMKNCWPGGGPDPFDLFVWDAQDGVKYPLDLPGVFASWSGDSRWAAFQSCLAATPPRVLDRTEKTPPWIYVLYSDFLTKEHKPPQEGILPVSEGHFPIWRPPPP